MWALFSAYGEVGRRDTVRVRCGSGTLDQGILPIHPNITGRHISPCEVEPTGGSVCPC